MNARDDGKMTPLNFAINKGYYEIEDLLRQAGAQE